ncbi:uncharacterized protein LOC114851390 [Betta splendens]|uniref:Uncharacterized protein LOC114851390 n=1 Tax=Betta splendens TaxID=158456 RepID=A0A6P7LYW3_BETSP|nr:uncharacterized protein LOC114851390 [Betta splendens]
MCKVYVLLISLYQVYGAVLYASLGENVTLHCDHDSGATNLCWYKQVAGEQPQIMSSFYKSSPKSNNFHNQFKDDKRFSVYTRDGFYHLKISNVQDSDSAMYYCGTTTVAITEFEVGTLLVLKQSSCRSFLQQPASDSVESGGSVTLNCTVHTGTNDSEHRVYWFKEDTMNSSVGIMYIHTHRSSECSTTSEVGSPGQSCVYSLSKNKVSSSDAGMYYCAVASCGHILFGKGTKLDVEGEQFNASAVLRHWLVPALLLSVIVNSILSCILCNVRQRNLQSKGLHPQRSVPDTADSQIEEPDALPYVALHMKKMQSKRRRAKSNLDETLYSEVRL